MHLILLQPGDATLFPASEPRPWSASPETGSILESPFQDFISNVGPCIELVSLHQGMRQQGFAHSGDTARAESQPLITELTCVKYLDKTSAKLYERCLAGAPIGKGKGYPTQLHIVRNSGDSTANILTISLRDAVITEIQMQSHPDDQPTEQFKLGFTEILWTYHLQHVDRNTADHATPLSAGWSVVRHCAITAFSD
jgi:type VI secretion system secreted protein Hcp